MSDASDPPRKHYALKPREFERVNAPPPAEHSAASTASPPAAGRPPANERIDVRDLARLASADAPPRSAAASPARPNEVQTILRDNLARADAAGLNALAPKPRRASRRRRDYLVLLLPVNGFFAFWAFGPYANAATFVYGLGGMALYSTALSWVMYGVMDDY